MCLVILILMVPYRVDHNIRSPATRWDGVLRRLQFRVVVVRCLPSVSQQHNKNSKTFAG